MQPNALPPDVNTEVLRKLDEIRSLILGCESAFAEVATWRLSDPETEVVLVAAPIRYVPSMPPMPLLAPSEVLSAARNGGGQTLTSAGGVDRQLENRPIKIGDIERAILLVFRGEPLTRKQLAVRAVNGDTSPHFYAAIRRLVNVKKLLVDRGGLLSLTDDGQAMRDRLRDEDCLEGG